MELSSGLALESAIGTQVGKASTLVEEVTARITSDITRGLLKPGGRLPTEKDMMASMGVSRTVIREAIAQLRAKGLVITRQGLGAFVADDALIRPLHITISGRDVLRDVLHLTDLRLAVEVESAALAALNSTAKDLIAIDTARERVAEMIDRDGFGVPEDFAFHRQVAIATHNPHFPRFLDFLGQFMIPRMRVHFADDARVAYENLILDQHKAIYDAIAKGNPVEARNAMRTHLEGARKRYAEVSSESGKD